ncbi:MAG: MotA/TolQ/ExbB proton channel family protein [Pseudohongiellaceae bacterium]
MKKIIRFASLSLSGLALSLSAQVFAQDTPSNLNELLEAVEQNRIAESEEHREREQRFEQEVDQREQMLEDIREQISSEEDTNTDLEEQFDENRQLLSERRAQLREVRANLNELLGNIQGVAGDFQSIFSDSLVSAQHPGRVEFLDSFISRVASDTEQVRVDEIERFWYFMQQELVESGRVVQYQDEVGLPSGELEDRTITRIGSFNAIGDGDYLSYTGSVGHLQVLPRQPSDRLLSQARELEAAAGGDGIYRVGIDPTGAVGGSLMANLINFPTWDEQVTENAGVIGFIIIGIGLIAILVALIRSFILTLVAAKVNSQVKSDKANKNNPLGRVLLVAESNPNVDTETLELKLGEAILQETPALERFLTFIKIIATVAPLMGLLGTVTGMIQVFQQITVYGAGDPTIMAGGISMALMTTVLGITVAIPTVLMHTWVKSKSDRIIHILEEQATGIIATKAEQSGKQA